MSVDLTTLRAGDTVHFRCGGSAEVKYIAQKHPWVLVFKDISMGDTYAFSSKGENSGIQGQPHLLDIIRITPRALTPEERLAKIEEVLIGIKVFWMSGDQKKLSFDLDAALRLARGEP